MSTSELDIFKQNLEESVHFSFKTVNTNILLKGGFRLSQKQKLDFPYLSLRILLNENVFIPSDYQSNAASFSVFKYIKAAMLDEYSKDDLGFNEKVKNIKPFLKDAFAQDFSTGTDDIDIRMRQLLIPKNGKYISISPLTAAGLNYVINKEVKIINDLPRDSLTKLNRIQTAVFGVGGSKPLNCGSLASEMQRPITLDPPKNDQDARVAFKVFHSGFDYYIPNKILIKKEEEIIPDIILWAKLLEKQLLETAQNEHQKWHSLEVYSPETNVRVRRGEMKFLKNIFSIVNYQGQQYLQLLKNVQDKLPVYTKTDEQQKKPLTPFLHPDVSFIKQGLIVPELRDDVWRIEFANDLAENIIGRSFIIHPDFPPITISLDDNAKGYLARRLRKIIR